MSPARWLALTVLLAVGTSGPLRAQEEESSGGESSLLVGVSHYDFRGTGKGTGFAAKLGVSVPLLRHVLILEPGLGVMIYKNQLGGHSDWFLPEINAQVQAGRQRVRPYLGAGFGAGNLSHTSGWAITAHGVGGIRLRLPGRWGARGEIRYRIIEHHRTMADIGVGVTHSSF